MTVCRITLRTRAAWHFAHDIVRDCSDTIIRKKGEKKPPWKARKQAYIDGLKSKSHATQIVSCADKLHNARAIMFDHDRIGDVIWDRFTAEKEETLWYYESLRDAFKEAWPDNPLLPDFEAVVERNRWCRCDSRHAQWLRVARSEPQLR